MISPNLIGSKIQGQYVLASKLGNGAFGEVYLGKDMKTNADVAVKLEQASKRKHRSQLFNEAKVYKILQGKPGIPEIYWSGTQGEFNVLIIKSLGPSLESLISKTFKFFSLKTTLYIAQQMIDCIEVFHENLLIHRDIKPDNFLIGNDKLSEGNLYIIDYGLAKYYKDPESKAHIPYKKGKKLAGTARYCSIFTHLGIEQSRRDDLEGTIYNFVYMQSGRLPWMGLNITKKEEKYALILKHKQNIAPIDLCQGMSEIANLLTYSRSLKFEEKPDYKLYKTTFADLIKKNNLYESPIYDWQLSNEAVEKLKIYNKQSYINNKLVRISGLPKLTNNVVSNDAMKTHPLDTAKSLPKVPSEEGSNEIPPERPLHEFISIPQQLIHSNIKGMRKTASRRQDRIQTCFFKNTISTINNEQSNFSADHKLYQK